MVTVHSEYFVAIQHLNCVCCMADLGQIADLMIP